MKSQGISFQTKSGHPDIHVHADVSRGTRLFRSESSSASILWVWEQH